MPFGYPKGVDNNSQEWQEILKYRGKQMRQPSQYGHTHTVKASVKRDERKDGVNYYIGNLKVSKYGNDSEAQNNAPMGMVMPADTDTEIPAPNDPNDLPF